MLAAGEAFCGSESVTLREAMQRQTGRFFAAYHSSNLQARGWLMLKCARMCLSRNQLLVSGCMIAFWLSIQASAQQTLKWMCAMRPCLQWERLLPVWHGPGAADFFLWPELQGSCMPGPDSPSRRARQQVKHMRAAAAQPSPVLRN